MMLPCGRYSAAILKTPHYAIPTATTADTSTDTPRKLMLRRHEAAAACGKGTSTWDRLTAAGLTPGARRDWAGRFCRNARRS